MMTTNHLKKGGESSSETSLTSRFPQTLGNVQLNTDTIFQISLSALSSKFVGVANSRL